MAFFPPGSYTAAIKGLLVILQIYHFILCFCAFAHALSSRVNCPSLPSQAREIILILQSSALLSDQSLHELLSAPLSTVSPQFQNGWFYSVAQSNEVWQSLNVTSRPTYLYSLFSLEAVLSIPLASIILYSTLPK